MSGATSTTTPARQPLDEVMLAMDVVDTLRHRSQLIDQELDSDQRDQKMMERLRKIYSAQGIEVSDRILKEGVEALKEERFVYSPPEPGPGTALAKLYVSRGSWGKWALGGLAALAAAFAIYYVTVLAPRAELPGQLTAMRDQVLQVARDGDAKSSARNLYQQGQAAIDKGDRTSAESSLAALASLRETLEQTYTVRIVNRPGEQSGLWRIPNVNESARNYYILVEAIDKTGKKLDVNITSEETGKTSKVSEWGVRVDQTIYNQVGADKQDDGIIQNNRFGVKERGYLDPDYKFPTTGAAITQW